MTPDPTAAPRPDVADAYGGRIRVRVGALVFDEAAAPSAVLLVEHAGIHADETGNAEPFWTPPGGGSENTRAGRAGRYRPPMQRTSPPPAQRLCKRAGAGQTGELRLGCGRPQHRAGPHPDD